MAEVGHLVVTRRLDQSIRIGDDVEVQVVGVDSRCGGLVKLRVTAPRDVSVHRSEVYDTIRRENAAAAAEVK